MPTRPTNILTIREARAIKTPGYHADGGGLYLRVDKSGAKRWAFIFFLGGKRKEMGLGAFDPDDMVSARDARDAARKLVAAGKNPIEERKIERAPKVDAPAFGVYALEVIEAMTLRSDKHRAQWKRTLGVDYVSNLQKLPVDQISTQDVLAALKPHWTKIPETADRIRGRVERVLDAARAAGHISGPWENPARWKGHLAFLLPRNTKATRHHPAMPYEEMPAFMAGLRKRPSVSARALEFTILTAARTDEIRFATWSEIKGDVWTIPAGRMKGPNGTGREHRVPLSEAALAVLEVMRPPVEVGIKDVAAAYVFPNRKGGALSNMAMDRILRLSDLDCTVHGFRSTFKDWAEDCTNFANGTIEAALAHKVGDQTERSYRRGDALEKRRKLMQAWEGYCAGRTGRLLPLSRPTPRGQV